MLPRLAGASFVVEIKLELAVVLDNGDDEIDYSEMSNVIECDDILELAALVPDKKMVSKELQFQKQIVGKHGVTVKELQHAATTIKEKILMWNPSVRLALKDLDESGDGFLTRDEVIAVRLYSGPMYAKYNERVVAALTDHEWLDMLLEGAATCGPCSCLPCCP